MAAVWDGDERRDLEEAGGGKADRLRRGELIWIASVQ